MVTGEPKHPMHAFKSSTPKREALRESLMKWQFFDGCLAAQP